MESKLWTTEANKCSWKWDGANADFSTEDFCVEAVNDDAGAAELEERFETAAEVDFRLIAGGLCVVDQGYQRGETMQA